MKMCDCIILVMFYFPSYRNATISFYFLEIHEYPLASATHKKNTFQIWLFLILSWKVFRAQNAFLGSRACSISIYTDGSGDPGSMEPFP